MKQAFTVAVVFVISWNEGNSWGFFKRGPKKVLAALSRIPFLMLKWYIPAPSRSFGALKSFERLRPVYFGVRESYTILGVKMCTSLHANKNCCEALSIKEALPKVLISETLYTTQINLSLTSFHNSVYAMIWASWSIKYFCFHIYIQSFFPCPCWLHAPAFNVAWQCSHYMKNWEFIQFWSSS